MAAKKEKAAEGEKIYTIPLRDAYRKAHKKRTPHAVKLIEKFLKTHTKADTIKLGSRLNEEMWRRGIEKPPRRVRVKVIVSEKTAKAELMGHDYTEFKAAKKKEKKDIKEKLMERMSQKAAKKEELEKQIEGKKEKPEDDKVDKTIIEKQIEEDKKERMEEKAVTV
ncbi:MAG: 50S ribosomal protein L31e [Candidatus Aenigmarchaeota archaeon]|nr:50S ribosomal protein L31e [Candidatus Aenigmarchaeota archaeon]